MQSVNGEHPSDPAGNGVGLQPQRFGAADIRAALKAGWHTFGAVPGPSVAFGALFALIGLVLLWTVGELGLSPMALPFAGGFMLVGPALLTGFFRLADLHAAGRAPRFGDALAAFARAPAGLWVVALLCAFLFLIWITDAAVLYAFTVGGQHLPYELPWLLRWQREVGRGAGVHDPGRVGLLGAVAARPPRSAGAGGRGQRPGRVPQPAI